MLIKFGQKEHMESLLKGNIYMNSIEFFKSFEDCSNIGDRDEGTLKILQSDSIKFTIGPIEYIKNGKLKKIPAKTFTKDDGLINLRTSEDVSHINLFCLYKASLKGVSKNNLKFILPEEIKKDKRYEYCVVFSDPEKFAKKISDVIKEKGYYLQGRSTIEYVDKKTYNGEMGIFKKFKEYEYQNEYRIAVIPTLNTRGKKNEIILNIGNIENTAAMFKTSELENNIKIECRK